MEETTCPVCGNTVPVDAAACPVDGFPLPHVDREPPLGDSTAEYKGPQRPASIPKPFDEGEWA